MNVQKNICIIPARGGSKRIPKKNIKNFLGKPMIAYAIEVAQQSKIFSDIYVSTDDESIAEIARFYGAKIPFIRNSELSNDYAGTVPVISDAILKIEMIEMTILGDVFCLYPCVPILKSQYLIDVYKEHNKNRLLDFYTFPVAKFNSAPQRAFKLGFNNRILQLNPEYERVRTQDLEEIYHDTGQFYCGSRDLWVSGKNIHSFGIGYVIPSYQVVDIDTEDDWLRAEIYSKMLKQNNK